MSTYRCPDVEWWDNLILNPGRPNGNYEDVLEHIREEAITNLIEHPIQMKPMESTAAVEVQVFLTKKEMKKMRRQKRREAWKEKQDKIRLGLVQPDEAKGKKLHLSPPELHQSGVQWPLALAKPAPH